MNDRDLPAVLAPVPPTAEHRLEDFQNPHQTLVDWVKRKGLHNEKEGGARCFVACTPDNTVVGYYALAAGSIEREKTPGRVGRNMPDPVPVIVLGRLATDSRWMGRGVGSGLLNDAIDRVQQAAQLVGIRAMLCHAIDQSAKQFYLRAGFVESPIDDLTVLMPIKTIRESA